MTCYENEGLVVIRKYKTGLLSSILLKLNKAFEGRVPPYGRERTHYDKFAFCPAFSFRLLIMSHKAAFLS
jgi:hypothetical protein